MQILRRHLSISLLLRARPDLGTASAVGALGALGVLGGIGRAAAQAAAPVELGVLPNISARVLMAQYQPLREVLAQALGRPVQVSTASHWAAFHQHTMAGEYDLVVTAGNLARLAQRERSFSPLAIFTPGVRAMLVVAGVRPITALTDLRGQTLALANPLSLVALRGQQWLAENGLRAGRDYQVLNTPTDDSVGAVLLRGDAMAAMLSAGEYRAIPAGLRAQLQPQASFAELPGFMVMASPRWPAAQLRGLRDILLAVGDDARGREFLASTGFDGLRVPPAGLLESMDGYLEATRRLLALGA